ncbi:hypothetical protein K4K59_008131 [Colletotrichum sp. SAR11_240]|nr:hypothetical protein K4K59_008131 [Colletotrichum sp. SAR11_240]
MKNIAAYPRGFDPVAEVDEKVIAKAEIVRLLSGGLGSGCQVLLCKMAEYPQTLAQPQMPFPAPDANGLLADHFVLKVSDGGVFPSGGPFPPWNNWELADQAHGRDSSALKYLYQKHLERGKIMGDPYNVPSYFGTWVVKLPYDNNAGEQKMRYVGAVAMEFIRGVSISDLCKGQYLPWSNNPYYNSYSDDDKDEPEPGPSRSEVLRPRNAPHLFKGPEFAGLAIDVESKPFRLEVLKRILDGVVRTLHVGVEFSDLRPENTFVTILDDSGSETALPRVVFLNYWQCQIWEKTRYAKLPDYPDQDPLTEELHPIHPFERFSTVHMRNLSIRFSGWYPAIWDKHPLLFDCWLGMVFGKVEDSASYSIFKNRDKELTRSMRKIVANYGAAHTDAPVHSKDDFLRSVKDHTGMDFSKYMNWKTYQNVTNEAGEDFLSLMDFLGREWPKDDDDAEEGEDMVSSPRKRRRDDDADGEEGSSPRKRTFIFTRGI